jgi:hypothetical protein
MAENTDLRRVLKGYPNKWVALSADSRRVVGVANSPKGALKQARSNKEQTPILTRVPKSHNAFIL